MNIKKAQKMERKIVGRNKQYSGKKSLKSECYKYLHDHFYVI